MRWNVITDVNRFITEAATELRNVSDRNMIERPQDIFIEGVRALIETNFNTVDEQIVLPDQVAFLNSSVKLGMPLFRYDHKKLGPGHPGPP